MNPGVFSVALAAGGLLLAAAPARSDTVEGSCIPAWELDNFQPASPTFAQKVKSSSYFDGTAVIILLSSS